MSVRSAPEFLNRGLSITTTRRARFAAFCVMSATLALGFCKTTLESSKKLLDTSVARRWHMTALEAICAFAVLYGISFWSVPAALVVGGLAGVIAMEVRA